MLVRYSSSVAVGAIVTAALIYWMQLMIAGGDFEVPAPTRITLLSPLRIIETPPHERRPPPTPPEPRATPPTRDVTLTGDITLKNLTTGPVGPVGPVTPPGPPSPPARPDGRQGPWIADSNLMLRSQIRPIYPFSALRRELEGYVIVEFTVTKRGNVRDVRIVESSHTEFEEAAATAVAKSRYQPRVVDSTPVDVAGLRTQIEFVLDN